MDEKLKNRVSPSVVAAYKAAGEYQKIVMHENKHLPFGSLSTYEDAFIEGVNWAKGSNNICEYCDCSKCVEARE